MTSLTMSEPQTMEPHADNSPPPLAQPESQPHSAPERADAAPVSRPAPETSDMLRDAVEWYRSLTAAITDYTYTVTLQNGRPVETLHSATSKAVISYTQADFDADPYLWITMVPPDEQDAVREQAGALLAGQRPEPLEHRLIRKDGATIWVESHLVPRYDAAERLVEYTGVVKDITRRKRAEERRAFDDATRALGEVVESVAHEVRNPLNGILVSLELLQEQFSREPDRKACREYMSRIGRQAGRLKALMDDLLELRQPVTLEDVMPVSLHEFCLNTLNEWKSGIQPATEINFNITEDAKMMSINADLHRLSQALINLLNNAVEHTPPDGRIELRLDATPAGEARLQVIDAGEGIPHDKLKSAFNPFYTTRPEGNGLGLNLVKRIVEQHDGSVSLRNNGDRPGWTAEILLPPA